MEIKLGQMLVRSGVISAEELDEALKNQVIFGNRLGTSLIELGYLTEEGLAGFLSKQLQVPAVSTEELLSVPPAVLSLVPHDIVQKYRIIPYRLDNRRLTIVMADPTDLVAMDELAFITGHIIVPAVSPEMGIFRAMESCYGIRHEKRGIHVAPELRQRAKRERGETTSPLMASATASVTPIPAEGVVEFPPIDEFLGFHREGERDGREAPPYPASIESYTVDALSRSLADATDREVIADALITYFRQEMPVVALFFVRGKNAVGWQASVMGSPVADFPHLSISLAEPSALNPVVEGKAPYLGPIADTPANEKLLSTLVTSGSSALILPIVLMSRVVAILYLGNEIDVLTRRFVELQRLAMKTALSFEILILRSKILMS